MRAMREIDGKMKTALKLTEFKQLMLKLFEWVTVSLSIEAV
jgi:hypothetical protein